jgi:S1-C subfamily serine protease
MSSPFDQDAQSSVPPASDWPTQPQWPAPQAPSMPTTPPPPPAPPAPPAAPPTSSPWQPQPASPPVWQAAPAGPPMGPPPVPPAPLGAPAGGPAPRSTLTSSGSKVGLAVGVVVALLIGATAGGVASRAIFTSSDTATATAPAAPSQGATTPTTTPGTGSSSGSSGSGSGSSSGSSGQMTSWNDVVDAVTVGVVNIESRMSGGVGAGTGMVLSSDGEILTNNHVVEGASAIVVTVVESGKSYRASIVGRDPQQDVAVLQLQDASGLSTIPLGDSDAVKVGDQVAAIGNAGGKGGEPSVATGRVTGLDQQITASDEDGSNAETLTGMIQVDANVVPGDSGGPLANTKGQVIGMDSAAAVSSGGSLRSRSGSSGGGEGYAIPINKALSIAEDLKASGKGASAADGSVTSGSGGFLGVQVREGTDGGAEIVAVENGSPADSAGLAAGDVITGVDRTEVVDPSALVSILSGHQAGDKVSITYVGSDGTTHTATATLTSK